MISLLSALIAAVVILTASPSHALLIETPNTYRAEFDFSGEASLPFERVDASFSVDEVIATISAGESYSFTLFDEPGDVISTDTFIAAFQVGLFSRTFFLTSADLVDGIGFIEVTGLNGDFELASAKIVARDFLGEVVAERSLSFAISVPVPEPQTYALMLAGLGLLGFGARRRKKALDPPAA